MPPYDEADVYNADTHNYGVGNHQLLQQLAADVREIRQAQKEQGRSIAELQVSMGKMETQVIALQRSGRAEAHVDGSTIREGLWLAVAIIALLVAVLWVLRPWIGFV